MRPSESFVGQPIRGLETMLRVIAENDSKLPTVVPDGIFSQEDVTAVSAFQRKYGLPVTGIVDENTWDKIVNIYEVALINVAQAEPIEIIIDPGQIYRSGDSGANIYLLQSMLQYLSLFHPNITRPNHNGILDSSTAEALKGFQILAGLEPTGELDKRTWKYLVKQFTLNANKTQI